MLKKKKLAVKVSRCNNCFNNLLLIWKEESPPTERGDRHKSIVIFQCLIKLLIIDRVLHSEMQRGRREDTCTEACSDMYQTCTDMYKAAAARVQDSGSLSIPCYTWYRAVRIFRLMFLRFPRTCSNFTCLFVKLY